MQPMQKAARLISGVSIRKKNHSLTDNIMEALIIFVKSDFGIGIAWFCTVFSSIFAFFKTNENKILKLKITKLESIINIGSDHDTVNQNGDKNVYTKNNSGGMKINM